MKSKRLIVILCALAFLTVLIVINSTIFTLQNISINWLTSTIQLENKSDYDLTSGVDKGGSIFLVNKSQIAAKLEKNNSYLRVISIETIFPNKIVIHSAERESLYAVRMPSVVGSTDYKYAIVDEFGKVLEFTSSAIFAQTNQVKPIRVFFGDEKTGISLSDDGFIKGEVVKIDYVKELLTTLGLALRQSYYTPETAKGVFSQIVITPQGEHNQVELQTRNGMIIRLTEAEEYTADKLLEGLAVYNHFHQEGVSAGVITVVYSDKYGIVATKPIIEG